MPALLLVGGCLLESQADPDARQYQDPYEDADPYPGFRDGGCSPGQSGDICTDGGTVVAIDASLPDAEPPPPDASCEEHTFEYVNGTATTVWVTGSFTDPEWAETPPQALELVDFGGGIWRLTTMVGSGHHSYKFVIDGETWIADPANPNQESDGFGGFNSVLELCM